MKIFINKLKFLVVAASFTDYHLLPKIYKVYNFADILYKDLEENFCTYSKSNSETLNLFWVHCIFAMGLIE